MSEQPEEANFDEAGLRILPSNALQTMRLERLMQIANETPSSYAPRTVLEAQHRLDDIKGAIDSANDEQLAQICGDGDFSVALRQAARETLQARIASVPRGPDAAPTPEQVERQAEVQEAQEAHDAAEKARLEDVAQREREEAFRRENEALKAKLAALEAEREAMQQGAVAEAEPMTENQRLANLFASAFNSSSIAQVPPPARTLAIAGIGRVVDGWTVAFHDPLTEFGITAVFWGRGHMKAFIEASVASIHAEEVGARFGKFFGEPKQASSDQS